MAGEKPNKWSSRFVRANQVPGLAIRLTRRGKTLFRRNQASPRYAMAATPTRW